MEPLDSLYTETLRSILIFGATNWPEQAAFSFESGDVWTRSESLRVGTETANALAAADVEPGDVVGVFMDNGPDVVRAWLGVIVGGFVVLPLNTALRGQVLVDVCERARPKVIVVEDRYRDRFAGGEFGTTQLVSPKQLTSSDSSIPEVVVAPWDVHALMLTSGTTGGSKASLSTHAFMQYIGAYLLHPATGLGADDVFLADLPFCHLSFLAPAVQMLRAGGSVAVRRRPVLEDYWRAVTSCGATFSVLAGTMPEFLFRQPASPLDREHSLRVALASPLPSDPRRFEERFGVGLMTAYGLTEGSIVCVKYPDEHVPPGSCGRSRPHAQLRVVDEHDLEVPAGTPGQLLIRNSLPWVTSQGYANDDRATLASWTNQWLHTGDLMSVDEDGYFYFHDRAKDALRRRGENISSVEVEREVLAHPSVLEAACVPAPQKLGADDEVKVFVVCKPGATLDLDALVEFLVPRMPYYMVPRYFEMVDGFPKTASARIRKVELRQRGNTEQTWDRLEHGLRVTRDGLIREVLA
jgi:crotonobetaine/carnitine-CoA ligase